MKTKRNTIAAPVLLLLGAALLAPEDSVRGKFSILTGATNVADVPVERSYLQNGAVDAVNDSRSLIGAGRLTYKTSNTNARAVAINGSKARFGGITIGASSLGEDAPANNLPKQTKKQTKTVTTKQ